MRYNKLKYLIMSTHNNMQMQQSDVVKMKELHVNMHDITHVKV